MNRTRLLLLALLVSLGLNLFLIGGIVYRVNNIAEFSGRPLPPNVNWMVRDLSDARRAELQPLMLSSEEEIRPVRRQLFESQRRVNELMADTNYDPATLDQAFAELRSANVRYQEMSHRHSVAMLNELSDEERRVAVELINRRGPRDGRDRRDENNEPRGDGPRGSRPDFQSGPPGPPGPGQPPLPVINF